MKKRILFFMSLLLCLTMLYVVTDYIWAIEFVGNKQISNEELNDFLEEEKIYYGMKKEILDCEETEKHLRAYFPNVTWTSIYFEGTKLYVSLFPCNECAKAIIQAGIKTVVYDSDKYAGTPSNVASKKMFDAAGVEYIKYNRTGKKIEIDV